MLRSMKKCAQHGLAQRPVISGFDSGTGNAEEKLDKSGLQSPSSLENIMPASIVVASAARTPVGSFNGAFANTPAHELGAVAVREALVRAGVEARKSTK